MGGIVEYMLNGDPLWWAGFVGVLLVATIVLNESEIGIAALSGYVGWVGLGLALAIVEMGIEGEPITILHMALTVLCIVYAALTTLYNVIMNGDGFFTHFLVSALMVVACWATFDTGEAAILIILAIVVGVYAIFIGALQDLWQGFIDLFRGR